MNHNIFVNRVLNLRKIKYIGLDMDHTLIRYNTTAFESLVYDLVVKKLIQIKCYPESIRDLVFHYDDSIRGLVIDSKNGNILKLSRYGAIRESYHGTKHINFTEQKAMYRSIYVDLSDPNYFAIDTSFSIAFCNLYAQLIDLKDQNPTAFPNYQTIALDVLNTVDSVHQEGYLKQYICQNLDTYVIKDKVLIEGMKRFIKNGKKIFLLTNSEYFYTNLILEHAVTPFLEPNQTWLDLFEFVITSANKPRFFYDNLKFLAIDPKTGDMKNTLGKIQPGVYQGGNARKFTHDLDLNGDEILYIGDHIYGDILRLKKDCNWRTALVVEELEEEIIAQSKALPLEKKIQSAMRKKMELEQHYIELHTKNVDSSSPKNLEDMQEIQKTITEIDQKVRKLIIKQQAFFNHKWGKIFRAGAEESFFAYQVDRFACIYMSKLSDFFMLSPITYFRAYRRILAHDMAMFETDRT